MSNEMNMPGPSAVASPGAQAVSDLMDGESSAASAEGFCRAWAGHGDLRADWHAFHVIGDVLRSEELGCAAQDEAFLQRLRERLAQEPVVLAPAALPAATSTAPPRGNRWVSGLGVAAALVVVASAALVMREPAVREAPAVNTVASVAPPAVPAASAASVAVAPVVEPAELAQVANATLVHNAQLERYLNAHKQYSGTSAFGPSPGFLRSATYETPSR